jgi:hypothetical protein
MEEIVSTPNPENNLLQSPTQVSNSDIKTKKGDTEPLDMLYLYVKELKEPNYFWLAENTLPSKPCEHFNRSYLPNGQPVAFKSF